MKYNTQIANGRKLPSDSIIDKADPRAAMEAIGHRFPNPVYRGIQQLLTEVSGKAPFNVEPLVEIKSWHRQLLTLATVALSITMVATAINIGLAGILLLIVPAWLLMSASLRTGQVSFTHYASHGALAGNRHLNILLGEMYSVLGLYSPLWEYQDGHVGGHHGKLNGREDPDGQFLSTWGFKPGCSLDFYWRHTWKLIFSPSFHGKLLITRFTSNFVPGKVLRHWQRDGLKHDFPTKARVAARKWAAVVFHLGMLFAAWSSANLSLYVFGYLIPLILGFNVLSLFQNISEHQPGLVPEQSPQLRGETRFTAGRFFGKAPEGNNLRFLLHVLLVALPSKLLVVGSTELQSHDFHHDPESKIWRLSEERWPMAHYARRDAQAQYGVVYKENWNFREILNHTFLALSSMSDNDYQSR